MAVFGWKSVNKVNFHEHYYISITGNSIGCDNVSQPTKLKG